MEAKIYYQKSQYFCGLLSKFCFVPDVTHELIDTKELYDTSITCLEQLFFHYNWMWNGDGICPSYFTQKVRTSKDVKHSSMSVGDVVEGNGKFFVVAECGFKELTQAYVPKDNLRPILDEDGGIINY